MYTDEEIHGTKPVKIRYCKKCEIANEWCPICDVDAEMDAAMQYLFFNLLHYESWVTAPEESLIDSAMQHFIRFLERVEAGL